MCMHQVRLQDLYKGGGKQILPILGLKIGSWGGGGRAPIDPHLRQITFFFNIILAYLASLVKTILKFKTE